MPSRLVQVYPPSDDFPLGYADAVLFNAQIEGNEMPAGEHSSSSIHFLFIS